MDVQSWVLVFYLSLYSQPLDSTGIGILFPESLWMPKPGNYQIWGSGSSSDLWKQPEELSSHVWRCSDAWRGRAQPFWTTERLLELSERYFWFSEKLECLSYTLVCACVCCSEARFLHASEKLSDVTRRSFWLHPGQVGPSPMGSEPAVSLIQEFWTHR